MLCSTERVSSFPWNNLPWLPFQFPTSRQLLSLIWAIHCVKSVQMRSHFWSVFSCIWTEYRKIRTRNNSVFGHFSRSDLSVHTFKESILFWGRNKPHVLTFDTLGKKNLSIAHFSLKLLLWINQLHIQRSMSLKKLAQQTGY